MVDGVVVGLAQDYSGERVLTVLPGRHTVGLIQGDRVVAQREIFVDSQGIKQIDFTGVSP
jgi:hypothetical protein